MKIVYEFEKADVEEAIKDFFKKHNVNSSVTVVENGNGNFTVTLGSVDKKEEPKKEEPVVEEKKVEESKKEAPANIFVTNKSAQNIFGQKVTVGDAVKNEA